MRPPRRHLGLRPLHDRVVLRRLPGGARGDLPIVLLGPLVVGEGRPAVRRAGYGVFAVALVATEGFALPLSAEASGAEAAEAIFYVSLGLVVGAVEVTSGRRPSLLGVAILSGNDYRGWLGWAAVVVGVLGIVSATTVFFGGVTTLVQVLFGITGSLFLLWLGAIGIVLWRRAPKQAERAIAS